MKPGKQGPKHRALQGPGWRLKASGPGAQKLEGWKETFKRKACTIKRDPREGGVLTELALHNKNIPNLILIESKTKIPRVWGNLREDLGNLRDQINEDLTKNTQNQKNNENAQNLGFVQHNGRPLPP